MIRTVSARLEATVTQTAEVVLAVAVARRPGIEAERLAVTIDGREVETHEVLAPHGGRLHVARDIQPGSLVVDYRAEVHGSADPAPVDEIDLLSYRNPSRYADSDRLASVAFAHFQGLEGRALVHAVTSWVGANLAYLPGSSTHLDGATDSYVARAGVCRDFAHLVITFLRAMGLPARLVAVYAPGLDPMDFHAVAEVYVEEGWHIVDATGLAPRQSLVRIATGRDAADTAFLNVLGGRLDMGPMTVSAVISPDLPRDNPAELVRLV